MQKQDEEKISLKVTKLFAKLRSGPNNALDSYLNNISDNIIDTSINQRLRVYGKSSDDSPLSEEQINKLSVQLMEQILNEILQKARPREATHDVERDGAELFYRRALSCVSRQCFFDAERFLKRCVEISPNFLDGWRLLIEVLEENGKTAAARTARATLDSIERKS